MVRVYATGNGVSYFVASRTAMDDAIQNGMSLHVLDDDGADRLIATPEDGYLEEPPVMMHVNGGASNE